MGLVHAEIQIINHEDKISSKNGYLPSDQIRKLTTSMMVDTVAVMLAINEQIKNRLGLTATETQSFTLADGKIIELEVVAGVELHFENRWCITDPVVLKGNTKPLFGAVPMELMDLVVSPFDQKLEVNPKHPIKPQHMLAWLNKLNYKT